MHVTYDHSAIMSLSLHNIKIMKHNSNEVCTQLVLPSVKKNSFSVIFTQIFSGYECFINDQNGVYLINQLYF